LKTGRRIATKATQREKTMNKILLTACANSAIYGIENVLNRELI